VGPGRAGQRPIQRVLAKRTPAGEAGARNEKGTPLASDDCGRVAGFWTASQAGCGQSAISAMPARRAAGSMASMRAVVVVMVVVIVVGRGWRSAFVFLFALLGVVVREQGLKGDGDDPEPFGDVQDRRRPDARRRKIERLHGVAPLFGVEPLLGVAHHALRFRSMRRTRTHSVHHWAGRSRPRPRHSKFVGGRLPPQAKDLPVAATATERRRADRGATRGMRMNARSAGLLAALAYGRDRAGQARECVKGRSMPMSE
jgi:hypothetical protein